MSDEQYAWLQSVLGERCPERAQADADYANLGTLKAVTLKYLYTWRAEMLASAGGVTITGALSVNWAENIKALERLITDVEQGPDDPSEDDGGTGGLPTAQFATLMPDFTRDDGVPVPGRWGYRG